MGLQKHFTKANQKILKIILYISFVAIISELPAVGQTNGMENRPIQTAVPFLSIPPDSRATGMGNLGAATSPDPNSGYWNPSKYAFIERDFGVSLSYLPWMRNLGIDDIHLMYFSGFKRISSRETVSASIYYFTLGEIITRNIEGIKGKILNPFEVSIDGTYARQFSRHFSGSVSGRFIYSKFGVTSGSTSQMQGASVAVDVASYYHTPVNVGENDGNLRFGLNISNIGTKLSYGSDREYFIPTNLRLGSALKINLDQYNSIMFATDLDKLLVPTLTDTLEINGTVYGQENKDNPVPVAMIKSFYDAPGVLEADGERNVFKEELREVGIAVGTEYWYADQFALRMGYYYKHPMKGGQRYFTMGLGLKLNIFSLDISYLVPRSSQDPLGNTVRFSLLLDFQSANEEANQD